MIEMKNIKTTIKFHVIIIIIIIIIFCTHSFLLISWPYFYGIYIFNCTLLVVLILSGFPYNNIY
jgi:hypothetical protein